MKMAAPQMPLGRRPVCIQSRFMLLTSRSAVFWTAFTAWLLAPVMQSSWRTKRSRNRLGSTGLHITHGRCQGKQEAGGQQRHKFHQQDKPAASIKESKSDSLLSACGRVVASGSVCCSSYNSKAISAPAVGVLHCRPEKAVAAGTQPAAHLMTLSWVSKQSALISCRNTPPRSNTLIASASEMSISMTGLLVWRVKM